MNEKSTKLSKMALAVSAYRSVHSLSVRELAKEIGVDHVGLWRFEKGKEISGHHWKKIVAWFLIE